jgi:hypothetical protein
MVELHKIAYPTRHVALAALAVVRDRALPCFRDHACKDASGHTQQGASMPTDVWHVPRLGTQTISLAGFNSMTRRPRTLQPKKAASVSKFHDRQNVISI